MSAQIYYDRKEILVTLTLLKVHNDIYSIAKFDSIDLKIEKPNRRDPLVWIIMGIVGLIFVVGIIFIAIGIYRWTIQKPVYFLMGKFGTSKVTLYRSVELEQVKVLQAALQTAIAHNRSIVALLKAAKKKEGLLTKAEMVEIVGLELIELQPILDILVDSHIALSVMRADNTDSVYDFNETLFRMSTVLQLISKRRVSFSVQETSAATGLSLSDAQTTLDSLVNLGYATASRDSKFGGVCYRFVSSSEIGLFL